MKNLKYALNLISTFGLSFLFGVVAIRFFVNYEIKIVERVSKYHETVDLGDYMPWENDEIWVVRNNRVKLFWVYGQDGEWRKVEIIPDDQLLKDLPDEDYNLREDNNPIEKF